MATEAGIAMRCKGKSPYKTNAKLIGSNGPKRNFMDSNPMGSSATSHVM